MTVPLVIACLIFLLVCAVVWMAAGLGAAAWLLLGPLVFVAVVFLMDKMRVD